MIKSPTTKDGNVISGPPWLLCIYNAVEVGFERHGGAAATSKVWTLLKSRRPALHLFVLLNLYFLILFPLVFAAWWILENDCSFLCLIKLWGCDDWLRFSILNIIMLALIRTKLRASFSFVDSICACLSLSSVDFNLFFSIFLSVLDFDIVKAVWFWVAMIIRSIPRTEWCSIGHDRLFAPIESELPFPFLQNQKIVSVLFSFWIMYSMELVFVIMLMVF